MNKTSKQNKEYTYFFKDGGFNTEWATNKSEAYKKAKARWAKELPSLVDRIDKASFHIATEAETKDLLSRFW
ncbi:MAG: hypothetical protein EBT82_02430 [Micrococcales bacterium]|nr:hypothetical protein [Micrococcales bacterium]NBR54823.1 hypothetical protein [Micrococcales bacterium]